MQRHRRTLVAGILAVASLGGATPASAHTRVDPTSLTPPLEPYRICYQDGPRVSCDTSTDNSWANLAMDDLGCGTIYETGRDIRHATRWYENGLLVERIVQDRFRGSWSLSPTGAGPTVEIAANFSWDENFVVPGDLSSDVETAQGSQFRVQGLGAVFIDSGRYLPDGTHHG